MTPHSQSKDILQRKNLFELCELAFSSFSSKEAFEDFVHLTAKWFFSPHSLQLFPMRGILLYSSHASCYKIYEISQPYHLYLGFLSYSCRQQQIWDPPDHVPIAWSCADVASLDRQISMNLFSVSFSASCNCRLRAHCPLFQQVFCRKWDYPKVNHKYTSSPNCKVMQHTN